jgi:hypothetical protein
VNGKVSIDGGLGAGIYTTAGSGTVTQLNSPRITGAPGISESADYDDSVEAVFGVSKADLRVVADSVVTAASTFPYPVAQSQLYYVDVPLLTFTSARPLTGSAVVCVDGDVEFAVGSKSFFSGLLYVDGDLTIREPCEINGTLIVTGSVNIEGASDWVNISFDDGSLNRLRTDIGQYRLSAAIRKHLSAE